MAFKDFKMYEICRALKNEFNISREMKIIDFYNAGKMLHEFTELRFYCAVFGVCLVVSKTSSQRCLAL